MNDYLQQKLDMLKLFLPYLRENGQQLMSSVGNFISPLAQKFNITQGFGNYNPLYQGLTPGSVHEGLDLATPLDTQVFSPISGNVQTGYDPGGYGQYVRVIDPNTGMQYQFSHLDKYAGGLGGQVKAGQQLGYTGGVGARKGNSTGAHLDISVKKNNKYVDPLSIEALKRVLTNG